MGKIVFHEKRILKKELKGCYNFFIKEANTKENSKGYGLVRDKNILADEIASIASVGYGLAALVIGVEHRWISRKKAYERAKHTLDTFLQNVEGEKGFFYHFIDMETGKRQWNCEISIIDTAIFICGAIVAGEYFEKEVKEKAMLLFDAIDWNWYTNPKINQFYMGYSPERGFWGKWDMYAEQLMLYVLGASSRTHPIDISMYDNIQKPVGDYKDIKSIIYTYCGTLFTYQYSHAWIDFRKFCFHDHIDWWENSVKATKANRKYCIDCNKKFKTFGENSWGLTACVGPKGYSGGFGAKPCFTDIEKENDGTISPCGAAGSIVFTPEESIKALKNYYDNYPKLWCKYGFRDAYNLEGEKPWYSTECIGIDKGITLVMIENYFSGIIWKLFMNNKEIKKGMEALSKKETVRIDF